MSNNLLNARSGEQAGEAEQLLPAEAEHVCVCPPSEESIEGALASFALGLLSEDETKAVAAHILACPACLLKFYQLRASLDAARRRGIVPGDDDDLPVANLEATLDALESEAVPDIPLGAPEIPLDAPAALPLPCETAEPTNAAARVSEDCPAGRGFEELADGDVEYECSLAATGGAYRAPSRRKFLGVVRLAAALLMFTGLAKLYQTYVAPQPPDAARNQAKLEQPTATTTPPPTATPPPASRAMTTHATASSATAAPAPRDSPPAVGESLAETPNSSDARGASCVVPPAPSAAAGQTARAATPRALKLKAAGGDKTREAARAGGKQQPIPIYVKVFVKDDKPLQKVILRSFVAALKREGYFKVLTDAPGRRIPDDVYEVSLDFDRDADCFGTLFARLYDPNSTQIWDAEKSCHSYPKREMLMLTSKELVENMVTLIKEHESGD